MKKIFLPILVFIVTLVSSALFSTPHQASAAMNPLKDQILVSHGDTSVPGTVSDLFINFMDKGFANVAGLTVKDSNGVDITKKFIGIAAKYYSVKDYKTIQDMIVNENMSISITEVTPLLNKNMESPALVSSSIIGENVSQYFYHKATDLTTGKYTKDWTVRLGGNFSYYSTPPYNVTYVNGPTLSYTGGGFGTGWSPYFDNIYTSHSYSGNAATFSARYNMRATATFINIITDYDFGTYTDTFTAYPSVLQ